MSFILYNDCLLALHDVVSNCFYKTLNNLVHVNSWVYPYILSAGSETQIPTNGGTDAKIDADNDISETAALREDQVQNAVNFLSHPKVRSSPIVHRRSFLKEKGLTNEEIDEAFRRVPVRFCNLLMY